MNDDHESKEPHGKATVRMPAVNPEEPPAARDERSVDLLRQDTVVIGKRVTQVEHRVGRVEHAVLTGRTPPRPTLEASMVAKHREAATDAIRQKSDADFGHAATLGAMIAHTKRLEEAIKAMAETQRRNDDAQDAALVVITRELGIESRLPTKMQKSLPPPAANAGPPLPPVLGRLEQRAKSSQIVQFVIALGIVADVLRGLLLHH